MRRKRFHHRKTASAEMNFLMPSADISQAAFEQFSKKSWRTFLTAGRVIGVGASIIIIALVVFTSRVVISGERLAESFGNESVLVQLKHLVHADDKPLKGQPDDRINILLLGIGGEAHQGGQLTDTIILASLRPSDNRLSLLSIPRDLVAPIPDVGWQKINAAHAYGVAAHPDEKGAGVFLAKETVEAVTGQAVHYYIKADFEGFTKVIDALGGIRVHVPATFTDFEYPDNNYGYEPVTFNEGWNTFDGDQALKYTRSRHGTNSEGSDFARARRQQQILRALQARTLALETLLNPNKLLALSEIVGTHIETDMEFWEMLRFYDYARSLNNGDIIQTVLSTAQDGLLTTEINEESGYLLRPKAGPTDFSEIQFLAEHIFNPNPVLVVTDAPPAKTTTIAVQNGTNYPGLASQTATKLRKLSYDVVSIGNAAERNYERTVIYALSDEIPPEAIERLKEYLGANVSPRLPTILDTEADILIILGQDNIPKETLSLSR